MKIATYNMQHDRKGKSNWTKMLDEVDPDILLAQESLAPREYQRPLIEVSWEEHVNWEPVVAGWGSAVYVKAGQHHPLTLPSYRGWVVGVEIDDFRLGDTSSKLRVFSIHAPTAKESYQRAVNSILDMIREERGGCDIVIGGDFNLTISEPGEGDQVEVKKPDLAIQARLRDEFGLINCWRAANPDADLVQTLRWDRNPEATYHCDGLFVPAAWATRLTSCDVLADDEWTAISDHNPVVAEFS
ncbi:MAG: hypothetical protein RIC55_21035 [Pirellulaceae bacterium]